MKNTLMATILVATIVLAGIFAIMPAQTVSAAAGGTNKNWTGPGGICTTTEGDAGHYWTNVKTGLQTCRADEQHS